MASSAEEARKDVTTESDSVGQTGSHRPPGGPPEQSVAGGDEPDGQKPPHIPGFNRWVKIGSGGFGVVYRARDERLDRDVAVKTLRIARDSSQNELALIQAEARLAARLKHPNIVSVHDILIDANPPCFVMEWVDGFTIDVAAGRMDYRQKAAISAKIAGAVAFAHEKGVVHRDLKPGNVMVDKSGEPRILDFGLARRWTPEETKSSSIKGTPLYMAPEQFVSPQEVGPAADIYALGLILYQLLTKTAPPGPARTGDMKAWADREIPLPREINPGIPEPLQRICLKACERNPKDRYPSAQHLADDLERFAAGEPIAARPKVYEHLLEARVRTHLEDLALWEAEGLITRREQDRMERRYIQMAGADSSWMPGSRWLRWAPTVSQLGGWLIVISAFLWLFYWDDLTRWKRVGTVGLPTIVVNLTGMLMFRRQQRLLGTIFLAVGTFLIPIFLASVFSEFNLFEKVQPPAYELFPSLCCNLQLFMALLLTFVYCAVLAWRTRYGLFSISLAISAVAAYAAGLLLLGLKDALVGERFASAACWFWPLVAAFYLVATFFDRRQMEQFAWAPYSLAGISTILITSIVAWDAPRPQSWWKIENPAKQQIASFCFLLLNAVLYHLIAALHDSSKSRIRRQWAFGFYALVPPLFLIPLHLYEMPLRELHAQGFVLFELALKTGTTQVYVTELLVMAACLAFVALGVQFQWRWYVYFGLFYLAVAVGVFSGRHMEAHLGWPLAVFIVGLITMFTGMALEFKQGKINGESKSADTGPD